MLHAAGSADRVRGEGAADDGFLPARVVDMESVHR